ncbi:MAG: DUF2997 domain-containing protein [Thermanaerothrix sp.]|jgi:hypothetical protein|uniref:DUF2997 domain-containing protein n=1 Tax=Thermanaerothrix solaris TaxID=3058434 RepID=A0ABU3NL28_9CHLR|nr:DUF2997 domain-containing protein [Thermanaerothrix sp. 4228-RoL]MDT8897532.1 DUF2997 domain-containing protein [Thermanaerothrix sp. 4228-RoL]
MKIEEIEVTIDPQGRVLVHVRGVKGEACLSLTAALEEALGGKIIQREMTAEAHETPASGVQEVDRVEVGNTKK